MKYFKCLLVLFLFPFAPSFSSAQTLGNSYDEAAKTYQAAVDNWQNNVADVQQQYKFALLIQNAIINKINKAKYTSCVNDWAAYVRKAGTGATPYNIQSCFTDSIKKEFNLEMEANNQIDLIKENSPTSYYKDARYLELNQLLDFFENCLPSEIQDAAKKKNVYAR